MDKSEFQKKLNSIPEDNPDELDNDMLKRIKEEKDKSTITLEQLEIDVSYNGKLSLRVPKSLHKELVEKAKQEGVSLNQYALYKLSR